jgi:hypothetical protein
MRRMDTMATWNDVVAHLEANYKCKKQSPTLIGLNFTMPENRSQIVWVETRGDEGFGEWVIVSSAVAGVDQMSKLEKICRAVNKSFIGGVVIEGEYIMIRDAFPLANLDVNELEQPLHFLTLTAEVIEKTVTGGDNF